MAAKEELIDDPEGLIIAKDRVDSSLVSSISSKLSSASLKSKLSLHELSFLAFPNQSQSNVYGLVSVCCDGEKILLVATLQGEVFWLEHSHDGLRTSLKPISFSYIPGALCSRLRCTRPIDGSELYSG